MDEQEIKEHVAICMKLDKKIRGLLSAKYHNRDVFLVLSRLLLEIIMDQENPVKSFQEFKTMIEEQFERIKQVYGYDKEEAGKNQTHSI
jgi:hypothetical protein